MSVRLHRKLLKSVYPWELRMREHEGEFLLFTLHTSISSEFFTVSMSSNITSVVKSGGRGGRPCHGHFVCVTVLILGLGYTGNT